MALPTRLAPQPRQLAPSAAVSSHVVPTVSYLDELPPSARVMTPRDVTARRASAVRTGSWIDWWPKALLVGAALVAAGSLWPVRSAESGAPNWTHHQQAVEQHSVKWVSADGALTFANSIAMCSADVDRQTTLAVSQKLRQGGLVAANEFLRAAHRDLPDPVKMGIALPGPAAIPSLSAEMELQFRRGEMQFFRIFLCDSCAEDGDVVDVIVNGHRYATVPITNQGAYLSLPLSTRGAAQVVIRGVVDGGGGITVGCETSLGQGFLGVLKPGQEQPLGVTLR